MTTRGVVDIVFCIDASASMQPCFAAVCKHLTTFVDGVQSNPQVRWDCRLDFIAHCATDGGGGQVVCSHRSLYEEDALVPLYQGGAQGSGGRFFTSNLDELREGLAKIEVRGDEAPLIALDFCLDFPWRSDAECHRVVILLTDEPFEDGLAIGWQKDKLNELVHKIQRQRVMLFIIAPDSPGFDFLAAANLSEYETVDAHNDGLRSVDFQKLLAHIGKSISKSRGQQGPPEAVARGLFGQASWGVRTIEFKGR